MTRMKNQLGENAHGRSAVVGASYGSRNAVGDLCINCRMFRGAFPKVRDTFSEFRSPRSFPEAPEPVSAVPAFNPGTPAFVSETPGFNLGVPGFTPFGMTAEGGALGRRLHPRTATYSRRRKTSSSAPSHILMRQGDWGHVRLRWAGAGHLERGLFRSHRRPGGGAERQPELGRGGGEFCGARPRPGGSLAG